MPLQAIETFVALAYGLHGLDSGTVDRRSYGDGLPSFKDSWHSDAKASEEIRSEVTFRDTLPLGD